MKIGLGVMCFYDDDAPEPEGTVIFDSWPKVGDEVTLCDDKVWVITDIVEDDFRGYPVHCKRKE